MSVEFEKVVLEKLDELSKDMRETKEIVSNHTELINNLSEKVEQLEEKVDNNTASISNLTEKVNNNAALINNLTEKVEQLEEKVNNNTASISNLTEKVNNNTALINNLTKDVLDTQDIVKIQGQNLAHFEHECMLKLNALFDSFVANSESHAVFSKFIAQLNAESFDHKQRISKLEDYFKNTKIFATN